MVDFKKLLEKQRMAKKPGTAVISVEQLKKSMVPFMKKGAAALAKHEPAVSATNIVRVKNKVFSIGENQKLKGPLRVVILAQSAAQFFYEDEYDPDNPSSPVCYALAQQDPLNVQDDDVTLESQLMPDEKVPKKQGDVCATCDMNKPGSGARGGWTRACQSRRRVAFLFVDDKSADPQVGSIEISPLGLRHWYTYIKSLANMDGFQYPYYFVVTELDFVDTKDDTWYVGAKFGGQLIDERPEWMQPSASVKIDDEGEWLKSTTLGKKISAVIASKSLIAPPQQLADTPKKAKKPVTGAARMSVKDAKAARLKAKAAKKKGKAA